MNIYHYDRATGFFLGVDSALPSPLEPGVFLIPACATDVAPPAASEGKVARFNDGQWELAPIPVIEPAPEEEQPAERINPEPPTMSELRKEAYENEADPLFFKAQRGEATMEEWEAKIEEIRLRYPDQE